MGIRILAKRRKHNATQHPKPLTIVENNSLNQLSVGMRITTPAEVISRSPKRFAGDLAQSQGELKSMLSKLKTLACSKDFAKGPARDPYEEMVSELDRLTVNHANRALEDFQRQVQQLRAPSTKQRVRRRLGVLHQIITEGSKHPSRSVSDHKIFELLDEVGIQAANRRSLRPECDPQALSEIIAAINSVATVP